MRKKFIILGALILFVLFFVIYYFFYDTKIPDNNEIAENNSQKQFNLVLSNYSFSPYALFVPYNQEVSINLESMDTSCDLVIDSFNLRTPKLEIGEKYSLITIFNKKGNFEFYCSSPMREKGVRGILIVE